MPSGYSVKRFGVKKGAGEVEVVDRAELKEALAIVVKFANAKAADAAGPGVMVCTYTGVEVSELNDFVTLVGSQEQFTECSVKFVFSIFLSVQS